MWASCPALEARSQLFADVAQNQQWDECADLAMGEAGCHSGQTFVDNGRVEPALELLVDHLGDVLKVRIDLG